MHTVDRAIISILNIPARFYLAIGLQHNGRAASGIGRATSACGQNFYFGVIGDMVVAPKQR